ncbi:F0F1 ATP synthase subunit B [Euryhalocaulis caribicus]|uniref:F0F1 ATP synthase subunit B n=2 Tax=Euryhalocaulis TaxID=1712422 RepID=UPI0003A7DD57|nr:F0F1 ATP synthase subunit B [Euryhalocaulis caribicus]
MAAPETHGATEAHGVFPPFDPQYFGSQLFWLVVSFGLLYLVLSRFLLPRLGQILEERRDKIADDLDEAGRLNEEAKAAATAYENALADARAKAHTIAADAKAKIDAEIAEETGKVEAEMDAKHEEAESRIREAKAEALAHVQEIAGSATSAIVEKLIGKAPTDAEAQKAVKAASRG